MIRLSLAALAMAALAFSAPAEAKSLTVGANVGNVPWEFQDANSEIVGFEVELVKEVAKRMGYDDVAIENIPFNGLFSAVQSGRIVPIFAAQGKTFTKGKNEIFPIPQPQIDLSGGALTQNPGY